MAVFRRSNESDIDAEFEKVWSAYPKKVGKDAARKKWAAVRKRVAFEEIAPPLREYIRAVERTERQFIVALSRWLNEGRWQDDQAHAANRPRTSSEDLARLFFEPLKLTGP